MSNLAISLSVGLLVFWLVNIYIDRMIEKKHDKNSNIKVHGSHLNLRELYKWYERLTLVTMNSRSRHKSNYPTFLIKHTHSSNNPTPRERLGWIKYNLDAYKNTKDFKFKYAAAICLESLEQCLNKNYLPSNDDAPVVVKPLINRGFQHFNILGIDQITRKSSNSEFMTDRLDIHLNEIWSIAAGIDFESLISDIDIELSDYEELEVTELRSLYPELTKLSDVKLHYLFDTFQSDFYCVNGWTAKRDIYFIYFLLGSINNPKLAAETVVLVGKFVVYELLNGEQLELSFGFRDALIQNDINEISSQETFAERYLELKINSQKAIAALPILDLSKRSVASL